MDEYKVVQVLKEIFAKYGLENLRNMKTRDMVVKSYIPDMLNKVEYRDENLVLIQAMKSDAIIPLTVSNNVTGETARHVIEQLEREEHMRREDAEFVVRCIMLAQGGSPDMYASDKLRQTKESEQKYQGERKKQKTEKQVKEEQQETEQQESTEKCIACVSCKGGELSLYQERLVFTPLKYKWQLEILYQDIEKVSASSVTLRFLQGMCVYCSLMWFLILLSINAVFAAVVVPLAVFAFIQIGGWCKKGVFVHRKKNIMGRSLFNFSCKNFAQKELAMSIIQKGMKGELNNF